MMQVVLLIPTYVGGNDMVKYCMSGNYYARVQCLAVLPSQSGSD